MTALSIWKSHRPKDFTDLEWTKQLMNELLDLHIHAEKNKLNSENSVKSLTDLKKMEIKKIETEQLKYFPSGYENRNYFGSDPVYDSKEKIEAVCLRATSHAEQILESAKKQHESNLPAIENNKLIIAGIAEMMEKFGDRDNDGFHFSTDDWDFYLSFGYDLDGTKYFEHFSIRSTAGRNIKANYLDRTEAELQNMINDLLKIKDSN